MYENVKIPPISQKVKAGEVTVPQVNYIISTQELQPQLPSGVTYATYRAIRKDPTIALARALIIATVLSGSWSVECEEDVDDEVVEMIKRMMLPLRDEVMEQAVSGGVDFGWQGFEKVFGIKNGKVVVTKLKPLLQDLTYVLVTPDTGAFAGYKQIPFSGEETILDVNKALHLAFRVEGTNWYGQSLLENVRDIHTTWGDANTSASNYDKKIAGSHFVVYYPPGVSIIDSAETDNATVAQRLLTALESSGSISVPRTVVEFVDQLNANAETTGWKIEILEDTSAKQPQFTDRLKYLDALKVRGLLIPERSILEGEFGTKAEAGEHADMGLLGIQLMDVLITRKINRQVINQVLALNYGEEMIDKVYLTAAPLVDEQQKFLRLLYQAILSNPAGFAEEFMTLDTDAIKDSLGLPKTQVVAQAGANPGLTPEEIDEVNQLAFSSRVVDHLRKKVIASKRRR